MEVNGGVRSSTECSVNWGFICLKIEDIIMVVSSSFVMLYRDTCGCHVEPRSRTEQN